MPKKLLEQHGSHPQKINKLHILVKWHMTIWDDMNAPDERFNVCQNIHNIGLNVVTFDL